MKHVSPITATLLFAAGAAGVVTAAMSLPPVLISRGTTLNAALFVCLAAYAALLAGLSGRDLRALCAPFMILAALLASAGSVAGFVIPAAAALCWIRSGICFPGPPARRIVAEALTAATGLALVAGLRPVGLTGWTLGLWLFFLIQALYFAIIDVPPIPRCEEPERVGRQTIRHRVQALVREQKLERAFEELQLSAPPNYDR